ncbi:ribosome biogenesis factor YjgA [Glaciecola sp. 1036]|uniref:ribosome biogenesis factor YjgA n=1 Tax=Alteromonadaceae TaxID=72275 RepID=UPI003D03CCB9
MNQPDDFEPYNDDDELVSKTQLKKEADDLKKLGLALLELGPNQRKTMPVDDELEDALVLASKINRKKDGFRRQIQFIGKLLRQRDVEPIALALEKLNSAHNQDVQRFHKLERMRDALIANGDDEIQKVMDTYPLADRQKLRHFVRTALKEKQREKPPAASRALFQYLKELAEGQ